MAFKHRIRVDQLTAEISVPCCYKCPFYHVFEETTEACTHPVQDGDDKHGCIDDDGRCFHDEEKQHATWTVQAWCPLKKVSVTTIKLGL